MIHQVDRFLFKDVQNLAAAIVANQLRKFLIVSSVEHPLDHIKVTPVPVHLVKTNIPKTTAQADQVVADPPVDRDIPLWQILYAYPKIKQIK